MAYIRRMRFITFLLSMLIMTSAFAGTTLSRYITVVRGEDFARVAIWGINADDAKMDLFDSEYTIDNKFLMKSRNGYSLMGPGVGKSSAFTIINYENNIAPEVAYQVKISLDDSEIDEGIKNNKSIQWKLDNNTWNNWDTFKQSILSLSGDPSGIKSYGPGEFVDEFKNNTYHVISWRWLMDNNNDEADTAIGNAALNGDITAKINVKITAEQVKDLENN